MVTDPDNFLNWLSEQFSEKYLSHAYRNVVLHASIIEAVLTKEANTKSFSVANKMLLCSGQITPEEFCLFDKVWNIRNELVHRIFGLSQKEIGRIQNNLKAGIHDAYQKSIFLEEKLFRKYKLTRPSQIKFVDT